MSAWSPLPMVCPGCGDRVGGPPPCPTCLGLLVPAGDPPVADTLESVVGLLRYDEMSRRFIHAAKYRNHRDGWPRLAMGLARAVRLRAGVPEVVTWAPTSARRRRERGFDQAELIAREVAAELRLPARRLLVRPRGGSPQSRLDRVERLSGPRFSARVPVAGERVLLVDDVATTGATLAAAAGALRSAGASAVIGAVLAVTPPHLPSL